MVVLAGGAGLGATLDTLSLSHYFVNFYDYYNRDYFLLPPPAGTPLHLHHLLYIHHQHITQKGKGLIM